MILKFIDSRKPGAHSSYTTRESDKRPDYDKLDKLLFDSAVRCYGPGVFCAPILSFVEEIEPKKCDQLVRSMTDELTGLPSREIFSFAVVHREKAGKIGVRKRTGVHIGIVNIHLPTGLRMDHYVHGRDARRMRKWAKDAAVRHGLPNPEDPKRRRAAWVMDRTKPSFSDRIQEIVVPQIESHVRKAGGRRIGLEERMGLFVGQTPFIAWKKCSRKPSGNTSLGEVQLTYGVSEGHFFEPHGSFKIRGYLFEDADVWFENGSIHHAQPVKHELPHAPKMLRRREKLLHELRQRTLIRDNELRASPRLWMAINRLRETISDLRSAIIEKPSIDQKTRKPGKENGAHWNPDEREIAQSPSSVKQTISEGDINIHEM